MTVMKKVVISTIVVITFASRCAWADLWLAATPRVIASEDADIIVRISPGATGRSARAEWFARADERTYRLTASANLLNPMAPVDVFVANDGTLVAINEWGAVGYGIVLAFYRNDGSLIRKYALGDLYTTAQIACFRHSASSIAWTGDSSFPQLNDQQRWFAMSDVWGLNLTFSLDSGALVRRSEYQAPCPRSHKPP